MKLASKKQTPIIRTERGLTIAGTRITLYDVMDYVREQYPPKFICVMLNLTDEQLNSAINYINTFPTEVEEEYRLVLQNNEKIQQHYEEQNRERIARIATKHPKPGTEAIKAKLEATRTEFESKG